MFPRPCVFSPIWTHSPLHLTSEPFCPTTCVFSPNLSDFSPTHMQPVCVFPSLAHHCILCLPPRAQGDPTRSLFHLLLRLHSHFSNFHPTLLTRDSRFFLTLSLFTIYQLLQQILLCFENLQNAVLPSLKSSCPVFILHAIFWRSWLLVFNPPSYRWLSLQPNNTPCIAMRTSHPPPSRLYNTTFYCGKVNCLTNASILMLGCDLNEQLFIV